MSQRVVLFNEINLTYFNLCKPTSTEHSYSLLLTCCIFRKPVGAVFKPITKIIIINTLSNNKEDIFNLKIMNYTFSPKRSLSKLWWLYNNNNNNKSKNFITNQAKYEMSYIKLVYIYIYLYIHYSVFFVCIVIGLKENKKNSWTQSLIKRVENLLII